MRSFIKIVVALSVATFMVSTSVAQQVPDDTLQARQARGRQARQAQEQAQQAQQAQQDAQALARAGAEQAQVNRMRGGMPKIVAWPPGTPLTQEQQHFNAEMDRFNSEAQQEQAQRDQQRQQEQAQDNARAQQAQAQAQRELDLGPKKLSESELSKCYEMQNGDNVRQCIEILSYPNPAVRQLRRAQLLRAQQEYRAKQQEQARQEQQELYRLEQGQAQTLPGNIEYGR